MAQRGLLPITTLTGKPPPVILSVTDGKSNFRQMDISALKAIENEIVLQVGNPRKSKINDDLLEALNAQGVIKVKGFTRTIYGIVQLSETVLLTFREHLPFRVTIITLSFQVHKF